jgi:hypothetical protein
VCVRQIFKDEDLMIWQQFVHFIREGLSKEEMTERISMKTWGIKKERTTVATKVEKYGGQKKNRIQ